GRKADARLRRPRAPEPLRHPACRAGLAEVAGARGRGRGERRRRSGQLVSKLVVIGLDGGTESVLGLPEAGCRNIDAVRAEGASAVLRSTVPPITAAAWPSMMTGWNPGRHGMYDFRTLGIERYTRLWGAGHSHDFADGGEFVNSRRWSAG